MLTQGNKFWLIRLFVTIAVVACGMHSALASDLSIRIAGGWNLVGNTTVIPIDVGTEFGDPSKVISVWSLDAQSNTWAFYSPSFATSSDLSAYASAKGYRVLSAIPPGRSFWINAIQPFSLTRSNSTVYRLSAADLVQGWNQVATGDVLTPAQLNSALGGSDASPSFSSMWSWDSNSGSWYFFAPALAANNTLTAYIQSKAYVDFGDLTTGNGLGFWLNAPLAGSGVSNPGTIPTLSFTGASIASAPPLTPQTVFQVQATAIVYDATRDQLIAAIATSPTTSGLYGLDARTLEPLWVIATSSYATTLAISDDGSNLYAGLSLEGAVEQIDLSAHSMVRKFSTSLPPCNGDASVPIGALKIVVQPGKPNTIVASIGYLGIARPFCMLVAFDSGTPRPNTLSSGTGLPWGGALPEIQFINQDNLIGFDNSTTSPTIQRVSLTSSGLSAGSYTQMLGSQAFWGASLKVVDGRIFLEGKGSPEVEVDPVSLHVVKQYGRGGADGATYHPGLNSVIEVHPNPLAGTLSEMRHIKLLIEAYDGSRAFLKRRLAVDEPASGTSPYSGFTGRLIQIIDIGMSRAALLYSDATTESRYIVLVDMAAAPDVPAQVFTVQSAAAGPFSALSLNLPIVDGAFNPVAGLLVASVAGSLGSQGNSLVQIDPSTADIVGWIPLSSEPRTVTIDTAGEVAYITLPYERAVQQVLLSTGTLGWKTAIFPTFNPSSAVSLGVQSIAIKPGDSNTIAISTSEDMGQNRAYEVSNGVLVGPATRIAGFPISSSASCDLLSNYGPDGLVCQEIGVTTPGYTHFSWGTSGIVAISGGSAFLTSISHTKTRFGFGRLYSPSQVCDVATEQKISDLPILLDDFVLQTANNGVGYQSYSQSNVNAYDFYTMALTGSGQFASTNQFRVADTRFSLRSPWIPLLGLGPRRFALPVTDWSDGVGFLYIVSTP